VTKKFKRRVGIILTLSLVLTAHAFADEKVIDNGIGKLESLMELTKQSYVYEVSNKELLEASYKGLFNSLDSDSIYYNPEEFSILWNQLNSSSTNVGITIDNQDGQFFVASVSKSSSAMNQGIIPGDIITQINGTDVSEKNEVEIDALLSGNNGDSVTLKVRRDKIQTELGFTLVKQPTNPNQVDYEVIGDLGYIKIYQFSQDIMSYFEDALNTLVEEHAVKGIVLDVRDNFAGEIDAVASAMDHFIPMDQKLMTIDYRTGEDEELIAQKENLELPVVVLINERSVGSAEVLAGSMRAFGVTKIVGKQSLGDGRLQSIMPLEDGSGIKITIGMIYTSIMNPIDKLGIYPDYSVDNSNSEIARVFSTFSPMKSIGHSIKGMRDTDTLGAQQRLNYLGYTTDETGYFNLDTELEIAKFQLDNGLLNSGILNWETKAKLDEAIRIKASNVIDDLQKEKALQVMAELIK